MTKNRMTHLTGEKETEAQRNIANWKKLPPSGMADAFLQFDSQGFMGYADQFKRIASIDFGSVNDGFAAFVKGFDPTAPNYSLYPNRSLSMVLAVEDAFINVQVGANTYEILNSDSKFQVYFETRSTNTTGAVDVNYYGASEVNNRLYAVMPDPIRPTNPRYGVSTELRNQFSFNWQMIPASFIGTLLGSQQADKEVRRNVIAGAISSHFPQAKALLRVHKYMIRGKNLETLIRLLKEDSNKKHIRLSLGVNSSEALIGSDLFTLIVEVRKSFPVLPISKNNLKVSLSSGPELTVEMEIVVDQKIQKLLVKLSRSGFQVGLVGGVYSLPVDFNIQVPVDLSPDYEALVYVTPIFLGVIIKDKRIQSERRGFLKYSTEEILEMTNHQDTSKPSLNREHYIKFIREAIWKSQRPSAFDDSNIPKVVNGDEVLGEPTYLEFVHACPPFCDP
ncbi:MAG: hypothetical protein Roseis2KO_03380 [Roseivirga sp.]